LRERRKVTSYYTWGIWEKSRQYPYRVTTGKKEPSLSNTGVGVCVGLINRGWRHRAKYGVGRGILRPSGRCGFSREGEHEGQKQPWAVRLAENRAPGRYIGKKKERQLPLSKTTGHRAIIFTVGKTI